MPAADTLLLRIRAAGARATAREVDRVGGAVKRTGAAAATANRGLGGMASRLSVVSKGLKGAGTRMTHAGEALKSLTVPIALVGGLSIKMAIDFEESMDKIQGLVGASKLQIEEWKKGILALSKTMPVGPQELADALFFVASAGFKGEQAMNVLKISAMAASAGLGSTKTVADAVTSALNAYHMSGDKATSVTDTLVNAVRLGKMPVDALAGSIGQVLPIAAEAGVKFNEVAGFAAALSRSGANVNRTMTGVRFLLTGLINPSSKAAGVLKRVGLSAADIRKEIKDKGLLATLTDLKKRLPIQDFLTVTGGARGVAIGLGAVGRNSKQVAGIMNEMKNSSGRTKKAFDIASHTAKFKLGRALSDLKGAMVQLGDVLIPVVVPIIQKLAGWISKLAEKFQALSPSTKKTIVIAAILLAVLGPILILFGGVVLAVSALIGVVSPLIIGIAALAAAVAYAYIKWGWFRDIVKVVWTFLSHTMPFLLLITHIKDISKAVSAMVGFFKKIPGAIKSGFISALNWMIDRLNDFIGFVNDAIDKFNAVNPFGDVGNIGEVGHVGEPKPKVGEPLRYENFNPLTGRPGGQRRPRRIPVGPSLAGASASGRASDTVIHTHVHLDGREVAKSTHRQSVKRRSTS